MSTLEIPRAAGTPLLAPIWRISLPVLLAGIYFLIWLPVAGGIAGEVVEPLVERSAPESHAVARDGGTVGLYGADGTRAMRFRVHGKWLFFGAALMLMFGHARPASYGVYALLHVFLEAFPLLLLAAGLLPLDLIHEIQLPLQRYLTPAISFGFVAFVCFPAKV